MRMLTGQGVSRAANGAAIGLGLQRGPCNELGSLRQGEVEKFLAALGDRWRESEAGFGKCGGTRSAAHGAQFQCGKGATDWLGEPGRRRRRGIADGAGYGGAAWKA